MKMQKRQFRIGQLARHLEVEKFVIRFWEKEFNIAPERSDGGQRLYDDSAIEKFTTIKELLYTKGFTISGAKQQLKERSRRKHTEVTEEPTVLGSHKTTLGHDDQPSKEQLEQQILDLQKKLLKLRELL